MVPPRIRIKPTSFIVVALIGVWCWLGFQVFPPIDPDQYRVPTHAMPPMEDNVDRMLDAKFFVPIPENMPWKVRVAYDNATSTTSTPALETTTAQVPSTEKRGWFRIPFLDQLIARGKLDPNNAFIKDLLNNDLGNKSNPIKKDALYNDLTLDYSGDLLSAVLDDEPTTTAPTTMKPFTRPPGPKEPILIIQTILKNHPNPIKKADQTIVEALVQCFADRYRFKILNVPTTVRFRWCDVLDLLEAHPEARDVLLIDSQTVIMDINTDIRDTWWWYGINFGVIHSAELYDAVATFGFRQMPNITERLISFGCSKKFNENTNHEGPPYTYTIEPMDDLYKQANTIELSDAIDALRSPLCRKKYDRPRF